MNFRFSTFNDCFAHVSSISPPSFNIIGFALAGVDCGRPLLANYGVSLAAYRIKIGMFNIVKA